MPNVYKPGLVQIRPQYTRDPDSGDTPENITWWQSGTTSTPTLPDLTTMQAQFDGAWGAMWRECGTNAAEYTGSIITDWSAATGLQQSTVGVFPGTVGTAGTALPPQVSVLQSFQIQLRWRGGHFRRYFPYIGANAVSGTFMDTVVSTVISAMEAAYTVLVGQMQSSGVLGGQSPRCYKDKDNPTTATLYTPVSQMISPTIATQRRRVRHVGRK